LKPFAVFVVVGFPCFSPVGVPAAVPIALSDPLPVLALLAAVPDPLIAAPTFAVAEVGVLTSAPPPTLPACVPDVPLLAEAGFTTALPRPRSAHGLLTGGGAGTGPDACAGVVDVDIDDVCKDMLGRLAFDVFEVELDIFAVFELIAERSREEGVEVDVLDETGAGERI